MKTQTQIQAELKTLKAERTALKASQVVGAPLWQTVGPELSAFRFARIQRDIDIVTAKIHELYMLVDDSDEVEIVPCYSNHTSASTLSDRAWLEARNEQIDRDYIRANPHKF